jgi:NagD protein
MRKAFICDMDGVIVRGQRLLPGARQFLGWLRSEKKSFVFLTNSSAETPARLRDKMAALGVDLTERHFCTSALVTAQFLRRQSPGCKVFAIGGEGLTEALEEAGISITHDAPDYVVVGNTGLYDYRKMEEAARRVRAGARLIGTNPDAYGPSGRGMIPGTGALVKPIEMASSSKAYYLGKPNPLMMRHALRQLDCCEEDAAIIGDRMDTDIIAGIEAEIETVLVLSGVTSRDDLRRFPYQPDYVLDGVGDIAPAGPA